MQEIDNHSMNKEVFQTFYETLQVRINVVGSFTYMAVECMYVVFVICIAKNFLFLGKSVTSKWGTKIKYGI